MTKAMRTKSICHCINLRRATDAVTAFYDDQLKRSGLTVNQYSLLVNLRRAEPCSVSQLAERTGLERTTLVRSLRPLFDAGYVDDASPPKSRNREMRVTSFGVQKLEEARPLWEKAQAELEERVGGENVEQLTRLLEALETL